VFAHDAAGNRTRSAIITVHVGPEDVEPPTAPVLTAVIEGGSYLLRWTPSTDDRGIAEYSVWRNGSLFQFLPGSSITELSVGTGTWKVRAKDTAGKVSEFSNEVTIPFADTTPPTVTFDHGCNGTKVHDYVDFRPLVSDDRGPVTAHVLLDGEPYPGAASLVGGRLRIDWDTRRYDVPNGTHVMTIVARDGAGNETSAPCEWNVHNPTVTVPFTSPADGATVSGTVNLAAQVLTDGQTPDWTGQLPVGNPVTGVAFEVAGQSSQFDSTAPYGVAWDSTTVPNGTYTVRARVQWMDYSQARATNEIQITVDNPVPLPAPTGLAPTVTDDDVTLTWNAVAGATGYRVQRNGSEVGTTSGTSFTDADVPVGTHQYRVIAEDGTRTSDPSAAVSATIAPPQASGLVAAYGFEATSGTSAADSSGKGNTGTVAGATWAAGGKSGRALSFDGVNDMVTVPDSNLLDLAAGMTLEAWVKPTTTSDWRTVLLKERPGQLTYALYATGDNGRPLAEVAAGSQRDARGTAALPVGVWTHLAATYDRSTLRLYVNGTQVASTAVTGTLLNSTGVLRIGGNAVWGEYFGGLIDDVRVYERALSAAEIAADKDRAV
jgi:hypothetical protein